MKIFLTIILLCLNLFSYELSDFFDIEGKNPYSSNGALEFSALESKYLTPNAHGFRNELKKIKNLRKDISQTKESLEADVSFWLSNGAKTIFLQYHEEGTTTLLLVIAGDIEDKMLENGVANDGIFDIYMIAINSENKKSKISLGTAKNGQVSHFKMSNNYGEITVSLNDKTASFKSKESENVYLKFGSYLQAQSPKDGTRAKYGEYEKFYEENKIIEDKVIFQNLSYKQ